MTQNTKIASNFLVQVEPEQAKQIDEFRWTRRQASAAAAVRKLIEIGLETARAAEQGKVAA